MAKLGLPSAGWMTPSPSSSARAKVVFPAPISPSRSTRSLGPSAAASSRAIPVSSASAQPCADFHGDRRKGRGFDVFEGIADVLDNVVSGHAPMAQILGGEIAGEAVEIHAEKRGLERIHALADEAADHSRE